MKNPESNSTRTRSLKLYFYGLAVVWTAAIAGSLGWNLVEVKRSSLEEARIQARRSHEKDVVYRRWNAMQGGVYVPITERARPNPYLKVGKRDVVAKSGRKLTLINPAYMTRMVHEIGAAGYGIHGHITSLNPIRPENAADPWETKALKAFDRGQKEVSSVENIDGSAFMRLMRPLVTEQVCLQCHAAQGYKQGDIRGGISVAIPMEPLWAASRGAIVSLSIGHGILLLLGLLGLRAGARNLSDRFREQDRAEAALRESEEKHRFLTEQMHDIVWTVDLDMKTTYVSPSIEKVLGFTPEERLDQAVLQQVTPESLELLKRRLSEEIEYQKENRPKDRSVTLELDFFHKDGSIVCLESTMSFIRDENSNPISVYGLSRDVTERKRTEQRTRQLNSLRETLLGRGSVDEKMKRVTDGIVEIFDADLSRIWITKPGDRCNSGCIHAQVTEGPHVCRYRDRCLHLVASSGRYTHIDGKVYSRVPFGCYKIGRVAAGEDPKFLTNDVLADPQVHGHEWARELGLVSFAGHRLLSAEGKPIGTLALFAKHVISPEDDILLEGLANTTAQMIQTGKAEKALQESEEKYRSLTDDVLDSSDVGIFVLDSDFTVVWMNSALERYLGLRKDEAVGKDERRLIRERIQHVFEDPERFVGKVFAAYEKNTYVERFECHARAGGGREERWFEHWSKPVRYGLYAGGRIELYYDITERKRAEAALRESEEKYRTIVENIEEGYFEMDLAGNLVFCNDSLCKILGYTKAELIGTNNRQHTDEATAKKVFQAVSKVYATGESRRMSGWDLISKDGTKVTVENSVSLIRDSEGNPVGFRGICADITERKRHEELLIRAERLQGVANLASGVAHNFNNILQIVLGNAEFALLGLKEGNLTEVKTDLETILDRSRFGATVVKSLQSFTDSLSGKPPEVGKIFDLSGTVEQAIELTESWWTTRPEKEAYKIVLSMNLPRGCLVEGRESEILEVAISLIRNAVDALPEGGEIRITTSVEEDEVLIEVEDDGVGIPKENLTAVFEPFWTSKGPEFVGMRLASAWGIAKRHGGEISVESDEGKGATFTIRLPLAGKLVEETEAPAMPTVDFKLRILVVDDEPLIVRLLDQVLTRSGQTVFSAESGKGAIEVFKENSVDMVICDLGMPGMDGWEVFRKIRETCAEKGLPKPHFLLVTGYSGQAREKDKVVASGVDGVVDKPLNRGKLLEAVREVVAKCQ